MASAKNFYRSLTTQEKRFIDDKTMSTTLSVKNWRLFLQRASAYDAYVEKQLSSSTGWIVLLVFVTIGGTIAYSVLLIDLLLLIPLIAGMLCVWLISKRMTLKSRNINNYLREFFLPFLDAMVALAGEDTKLSAALDFRDPMKSIKPNERKVQGRDLKAYEAKYIAAKVMLKDGSYLETVVADEIRKISYRNPRGKLKSKTKTVHHYFQRLTLPKTTYALRGLKLLSNMEMTETDESFVFKLKGKGKAMNYHILTLQEYMSGIKHIYNLVINTQQPPPTEPKQDGTSPTSPYSSLLQAPPDAIKKGQSTNKTDAGGDALSDSSVMPYFWADTYFDRHDFDSTRTREDFPTLTDEDLKTNMFDS